MNNMIKQFKKRANENSHYFYQVVRDALKQLNKNKPAYVFNKKHIQEIKKVYPDLEVTNQEGVYLLTRINSLGKE